MTRRARIAAATAGAVALVAAGGVTGRELASTSSSSAAASSCQRIGFQSGVSASIARFRKLDPGGSNAAKTGAYDKLERSLSILVFDHDAACTPTQPPPTTTTQPPPTTTTSPATPIAPLTYNAEGGSNARYCVAGLPTNAAGRRFDQFATYDENGLQLGGRTEDHVDGLKGSRSTDGLGPCDPYTWDGRSFPPWPAASYRR